MKFEQIPNIENLDIPNEQKEILFNNAQEGYINYILKHKNEIIKRYNEFIKLVINNLYNPFKFYIINWDIVKNNIMEHDNSKLETDEFDGYRQYWFPITDGFEKDYIKYITTKQKHISTNKHHWEYWLSSQGYGQDIPIEYLIEMIADWFSTSRYEGSEIYEWYEKQKYNKNITLSRTTQKLLEDCLYILKTGCMIEGNENLLIKIEENYNE